MFGRRKKKPKEDYQKYNEFNFINDYIVEQYDYEKSNRYNTGIDISRWENMNEIKNLNKKELHYFEQNMEEIKIPTDIENFFCCKTLFEKDELLVKKMNKEAASVPMNNTTFDTVVAPKLLKQKIKILNDNNYELYLYTRNIFVTVSPVMKSKNEKKVIMFYYYKKNINVSELLFSYTINKSEMSEGLKMMNFIKKAIEKQNERFQFKGTDNQIKLNDKLNVNGDILNKKKVLIIDNIVCGKRLLFTEKYFNKIDLEKNIPIGFELMPDMKEKIEDGEKNKNFRTPGELSAATKSYFETINHWSKNYFKYNYSLIFYFNI